MGFTDAVKTCFRKYFVFSGRASRPEFWWFVLAVLGVSIIASILDGMFFGTVQVESTETSGSVTSQNGPLASIWALATLLPLLAAGWRRMHDTGRPGWHLLLPLLIQVATFAFLLVGVVGFAAVEQSVSNPDALRAPAAGIGFAALFACGVAQLVVTVLLIWWLSRRGDPGPNDYGDTPLSSPSTE